MNGSRTFQKRIRALRRAAHKKSRRPAQSRIQIGSWIIQEDSEGRLVLLRPESHQRIIIAVPEKGSFEEKRSE